jgi:hypothetical protein
VQRIGLSGRAKAGPKFDAWNVPLTPGVRELEDERRAVLVHALAELTPERNPVVVLD